eukprot:6433822-Ditylum_brightwellii.AAC.1
MLAHPDQENGQQVQKKDLFVAFKVHLIPGDSASQYIMHHIKKLYNKDVKNTLVYNRNVDSIVAKLSLLAGIQCWTLFESMLMGTPETQWFQHTSLVADPDCDQPHFQATIKQWLHGFTTESLLQDIIKWLRQLHKPRD